MKRRMFIASLVCLMLVLLTACGNDQHVEIAASSDWVDVKS